MTPHEEAALIYQAAAGDARVALFEMRETDADKALREAIIRRMSEEIKRSDSQHIHIEAILRDKESSESLLLLEVEANNARIAELREKLSNCEEALKHTNGVMRQKFNQVAELREKLASAESDERIDFLLRTGNDAIRERDRLRRVLEWLKDQMYNEDFDADLVIARIDEALAQPAEKETT